MLCKTFCSGQGMTHQPSSSLPSFFPSLVALPHCLRRHLNLEIGVIMLTLLAYLNGSHIFSLLFNNFNWMSYLFPPTNTIIWKRLIYSPIIVQWWAFISKIDNAIGLWEIFLSFKKQHFRGQRWSTAYRPVESSNYACSSLTECSERMCQVYVAHGQSNFEEWQAKQSWTELLKAF